MRAQEFKEKFIAYLESHMKMQQEVSHRNNTTVLEPPVKEYFENKRLSFWFQMPLFLCCHCSANFLERAASLLVNSNLRWRVI